MDIKELFEESVKNKYPYDNNVTCRWENETTIFVEGRDSTFYLREEDTKLLNENIPFPTVVHECHFLGKETVFYLKLKSQEVVIKEYQLGDEIVLKSQFKKGKQFSNTLPFKPFDMDEIDAIKTFYHMTETIVKNRKKTRIKFALRMLEVEKQGVISSLKKISEYSHIEF